MAKADVRLGMVDDGLLADVLFVWCWGGRVASDVFLRGSSGHAKLLVGPAAKIDQLAAFRAERPGGVVIPFSWLAASRAFHKWQDSEDAGRMEWSE